MFDLLLEGFFSASLPCSLILLVPGAGAVLAARGRLIAALGGFSGSATVLAWLRFADRAGDWPVGIAAVALVTATVLFFVPVVVGDKVIAALAGVLTGGAAAELWEPCVGPEFGRLLNELPNHGPAGLGQMAVFMLGVLAPLAGFVAIVKLIPEWMVESVQPVLAVLGGTVLAVMAVATAAGLHDDIVGRLFQWSLS